MHSTQCLSASQAISAGILSAAEARQEETREDIRDTPACVYAMHIFRTSSGEVMVELTPDMPPQTRLLVAIGDPESLDLLPDHILDVPTVSDRSR